MVQLQAQLVRTSVSVCRGARGSPERARQEPDRGKFVLGPFSARLVKCGFLFGVLLMENHLMQIWDIVTKKLCYVHPFEKEITAFSVLQNSFYM